MCLQPFFTKEMSGMDFDKLPGTGCGLGLSIVKNLISQFGRIEVLSEDDFGTTVTLQFIATEE